MSGLQENCKLQGTTAFFRITQFMELNFLREVTLLLTVSFNMSSFYFSQALPIINEHRAI